MSDDSNKQMNSLTPEQARRLREALDRERAEERGIVARLIRLFGRRRSPPAPTPWTPQVVVSHPIRCTVCNEPVVHGDKVWTRTVDYATETVHDRCSTAAGIVC